MRVIPMEPTKFKSKLELHLQELKLARKQKRINAVKKRKATIAMKYGDRER